MKREERLARPRVSRCDLLRGLPGPSCRCAPSYLAIQRRHSIPKTRTGGKYRNLRKRNMTRAYRVLRDDPLDDVGLEVLQLADDVDGVATTQKLNG